MKFNSLLFAASLFAVAVPVAAHNHGAGSSEVESEFRDNRDERKEMRKRHRAERDEMKQARRMKKIDTNEDGKLDLNEYLANAQERFNAMDQDQDGFVTSEEASAWRVEMMSKHKEARKAHRRDKRDLPSED